MKAYLASMLVSGMTAAVLLAPGASADPLIWQGHALFDLQVTYNPPLGADPQVISTSQIKGTGTVFFVGAVYYDSTGEQKVWAGSESCTVDGHRQGTFELDPSPLYTLTISCTTYGLVCDSLVCDSVSFGGSGTRVGPKIVLVGQAVDSTTGATSTEETCNGMNVFNPPTSTATALIGLSCSWLTAP